jgi:hypothetical protein
VQGSQSWSHKTDERLVWGLGLPLMKHSILEPMT